jgi:Mce-associated membrane protein
MADPAAAPAGQLTESTDDPRCDTGSGGSARRVVKEVDVKEVDAETTSKATAADAVAAQRDLTPKGAGGPRRKMSAAWSAALICVVTIAALAGLLGWLGFRAHQARTAQDHRDLFLQVGRQAAVNLTTIDWQHAEADVQRVVDGATGSFRDDFAARSQPFIDVVKQSKSTTVGTISEAGLESVSANSAQVLVAVSVKTSNSAAPQQLPRSWRMRIAVEGVGDQAKVSNVEFVP